MVHALHALSGGNRSGTPRVAAQLPDHGARPHRNGSRQRLAARRSDGRRRSDDDAGARAGEKARRHQRRAAISGVRFVLCADARPAARTGGAARHRDRPDAERAARFGRVRRARLRRAGPDAGQRRPRPRSARVHCPGEEGGRPGRGWLRPAGADAADAAWRNGRRRRLRQLAALRRPARVRRPACGVFRDARETRAPGAGPDHRRVGGLAGEYRLSHVAADARAAHPPREGDLEHLHGAGAAGEYRRPLRGLPRSAGTDADRDARARVCEAADARAGAPRLPSAERRLLRHASFRGSWRRPGGRPDREGRAGPPNQSRLPDGQHHPRRARRNRGRRRHPCALAGLCRRGRGQDGRLRSIDRRAGAVVPVRPGAHHAVSPAPGVQYASFGNADDALHPRTRAKGYRPRHVDDSTRLVHDEAERRLRNAADHVAGVREAASVCACRSGSGLSAGVPRARDRRCARSPASRRCRCSRTQVRKGSTPACW